MTDVRLSPSGKRLFRAGPGSIGLTFRDHGDGQGFLVPSAAPSAISGIDGVVVDITPGKLYDLEVNVEARAVGLTTAANFSTYYALREQSTGVWGAWIPMLTTAAHYLEGNQSYAVPSGSWTDALFDVSATTAKDRIRFGVMGDAACTATLTIYPNLCWARVLEYEPTP